MKTALIGPLFAAILAAAALLVWSAMQSNDSTLEIRASRQGVTIPDGFYVWHHLDANGIRFKSITPQNNTLLITFANRAQSEAAQQLLYRMLPRGYVIARQEGNDDSSRWFSLLRANHNQVG